MRKLLIAALVIATPALAQTKPQRNHVWSGAIVPVCRQAAQAEYNRADLYWLDRWIASRKLSAAEAADVRMVCAGYLAGAHDMTEGKVLPIDTD